ncbi:MAG: hypothetical protein HPM95_04055 [Alphaproteobacteria bacterium]|nr:hypothetical protein [Alphaproteobacteria bacterium]
MAFAAAGELDGALWLSALGWIGRSAAAALQDRCWRPPSDTVNGPIIRRFTLAPRGQANFLERFGFLRLDGDRLEGGLRALSDARRLSAWARRL